MLFGGKVFMNSNKSEKSRDIKHLFRPMIFGSIAGFAVILILLVIISLILSTGIVSIESSSLLASVSVAIGSFIAGLTAAKKSGKNGLLNGFFAGFILFLMFTSVSLMAFKNTPTAATLIRLILFVIGGSIGGIMGVGSSDKRKIV